MYPSSETRVGVIKKGNLTVGLQFLFFMIGLVISAYLCIVIFTNNTNNNAEDDDALKNRVFALETLLSNLDQGQGEMQLPDTAKIANPQRAMAVNLNTPEDLREEISRLEFLFKSPVARVNFSRRLELGSNYGQPYTNESNRWNNEMYHVPATDMFATIEDKVRAYAFDTFDTFDSIPDGVIKSHVYSHDLGTAAKDLYMSFTIKNFEPTDSLRWRPGNQTIFLFAPHKTAVEWKYPFDHNGKFICPETGDTITEGEDCSEEHRSYPDKGIKIRIIQGDCQHTTDPGYEQTGVRFDQKASFENQVRLAPSSGRGCNNVLLGSRTVAGYIDPLADCTTLGAFTSCSPGAKWCPVKSLEENGVYTCDWEGTLAEQHDFSGEDYEDFVTNYGNGENCEKNFQYIVVPGEKSGDDECPAVTNSGVTFSGGGDECCSVPDTYCPDFVRNNPEFFPGGVAGWGKTGHDDCCFWETVKDPVLGLDPCIDDTTEKRLEVVYNDTLWGEISFIQDAPSYDCVIQVKGYMLNISIKGQGLDDEYELQIDISTKILTEESESPETSLMSSKNPLDIADARGTICYPGNIVLTSFHQNVEYSNFYCLVDETTITSLTNKVADNTTLLENRFSAIESGITSGNEYIQTLLADQSQAISQNKATLADQSQAVGQNTSALADQSQAVGQNTATLADQSQAIVQNTSALADLEDREQFKNITSHPDLTDAQITADTVTVNGRTYVFDQSSTYQPWPFGVEARGYRVFYHHWQTENDSDHEYRTQVSGDYYDYSGTSSIGGIDGEWIHIQFPEPIVVNSFEMSRQADLLGTPHRFKLLCSNDGTSWNNLDCFDENGELTSNASRTLNLTTSSQTFTLATDQYGEAFSHYAIVVMMIHRGTLASHYGLGMAGLKFFSVSKDVAQLRKENESQSQAIGQKMTALEDSLADLDSEVANIANIDMGGAIAAIEALEDSLADLDYNQSVAIAAIEQNTQDITALEGSLADLDTNVGQNTTALSDQSQAIEQNTQGITALEGSLADLDSEVANIANIDMGGAVDARLAWNSVKSVVPDVLMTSDDFVASNGKQYGTFVSSFDTNGICLDCPANGWAAFNKEEDGYWYPGPYPDPFESDSGDGIHYDYTGSNALEHAPSYVGAHLVLELEDTKIIGSFTIRGEANKSTPSKFSILGRNCGSGWSSAGPDHDPNRCTENWELLGTYEQDVETNKSGTTFNIDDSSEGYGNEHNQLAIVITQIKMLHTWRYRAAIQYLEYHEISTKIEQNTDDISSNKSTIESNFTNILNQQIIQDSRLDALEESTSEIYSSHLSNLGSGLNLIWGALGLEGPGPCMADYCFAAATDKNAPPSENR